MEAEDLKIGDRVRPWARTLPHGEFPAEHSYAWREAQKKGQNFLYVAAIVLDTPSGVPTVLCSVEPYDPLAAACTAQVLHADWFQDADLLPYSPEPAPDVSK